MSDLMIRFRIPLLVPAVLAIGLSGLPALAGQGSGDSNVFGLDTQVVSAVEPGPLPSAGPFVGPCAPNPFNPQTVIPFGLAERGPVRLAIHDVRGGLVRVLLDEPALEPGARRAVWDGRDAQGRTVASGVYLALLRANGREKLATMVLLR